MTMMCFTSSSVAAAAGLVAASPTAAALTRRAASFMVDSPLRKWRIVRPRVYDDMTRMTAGSRQLRDLRIGGVEPRFHSPQAPELQLPAQLRVSPGIEPA